mgnify:CR=1 FL=1
MDLSYNVVFAIVVGIIFLILLGKTFSGPLKFIAKLLYNTLLGAIAIIALNFAGSFFSFHIALNIITSLVVGVLGIPGLALLIILKPVLGV